MKTLSAIYDELNCISDQLVLLSNVVSDEYAEGVGRPAAHMVQDAIFAVSQHIDRVNEDIEQIEREQGPVHLENTANEFAIEGRR